MGSVAQGSSQRPGHLAGISTTTNRFLSYVVLSKSLGRVVAWGIKHPERFSFLSASASFPSPNSAVGVVYRTPPFPSVWKSRRCSDTSPSLVLRGVKPNDSKPFEGGFGHPPPTGGGNTPNVPRGRPLLSRSEVQRLEQEYVAHPPVARVPKMQRYTILDIARTFPTTNPRERGVQGSHQPGHSQQPFSQHPNPLPLQASLIVYSLFFPAGRPFLMTPRDR